MSRGKKITMAVAFCMVVAGLLICACTWAKVGSDFTGFSTVRLKTKTHEITQTFRHIQIDGVESDVRLLPSQDGTCKVICTETEGVRNQVEVVGDTLTITRKDDRKWYEYIGIFFGEPDVEVYLPQSEYETLTVQSVSGDIEIERGLTFAQAKLHTTSGDLHLRGATAQSLNLETTSGDLRLSGVTAQSLSVETTSGDVTLMSVTVQGELRARSTSGDVDGSDVQAASIVLESTSGDVECSDTLAQNHIEVESRSGDIELERCDAQTLSLRTTSGDISGSLLSGKQFVTHTTSGEVEVSPSDAAGGRCEISTTSGDIEIWVVR